jgi:hypothetical protein
MPKAPRDKDSAAPKKRVRKAAPANGNGVHAENGNGVAAVKAVIPTETPVTTTVPKGPSMEEQIRARAYELYLQRGDNGGSPEQDWLRAVEEICGQQRTA